MILVQAKTIETSAGERRWQPKTCTNRAAPISAALRQYHDRDTPPASDLGCSSPAPQGHWWDPGSFLADLRNAHKKASPRWTCLDYGHTFGSQLAQEGVSLYTIAMLMGNSPKICRRHYAALLPESMVCEVDIESPRLVKYVNNSPPSHA